MNKKSLKFKNFSDFFVMTIQKAGRSLIINVIKTRKAVVLDSLFVKM